MTAIAFEERAGFNGQRFMKNVAFYMAGGAELHAASTDATNHTSADHDIVRHNFAGDRCLLTDRDGGRANVALNRAVDLNVAARNQVALNNKII